MGLKQELQELALANGMKYFGVASVDRFANMPEGHRPGDLLPGAKSVLVMGMVIPDGAIEGNLRAFEGPASCDIFLRCVRVQQNQRPARLGRLAGHLPSVTIGGTGWRGRPPCAGDV